MNDESTIIVPAEELRMPAPEDFSVGGRGIIRTMVRGAYDLQKLRMQAGLRICAQFRSRLGQKPGTKEEDIDDDGKAVNVLKTIRAVYDKVTDGYAKFPTKKYFKGDDVISSYPELCLIRSYFDQLANEERAFKDLKSALKDYPIWNDFMKDVKGCGPAMAAVIISEIDITRAKYASSIWRYVGLDVARDGRGRSRRSEHQIDVEYEDKDGKMKTKKSITFNPFAKTKLTGVLGPSFIKCNSPYRTHYDNYKHRLENHVIYGTANDGEELEGYGFITGQRRHNMSIRYMVKIFLADLYEVWRPMAGLPVFKPYSEAKLGMKPHGEDSEPVPAPVVEKPAVLRKLVSKKAAAKKAVKKTAKKKKKSEKAAKAK